MPYQKTVYDNRAIADITREAVDNIEGALDVGYHAVCVANCAQHMMIFEAESVFWPFFEGRLDVAQDFGPNGYHLYTSLGAAQDLELWDVSPENIGVMRAYVFNGSDEYLIALDQDFFTVEAQNAFTLGAWVNFNESDDSCILSKWDATTDTEKREWMFTTDNTGYITMIIYDETNNAQIGREYQTTMPENAWHHLVARYDGGTDAANIDIFLDGVEVDDADAADDVGFASMVNQTTVVRCGSFETADGSEEYLFDGKMWGPFFTLQELNDVEIWNLYRLGKAALDLDLIAGMPD
jgi:hypothetical protein